MKVIIFGATGTIGKALVKEAIKRKYQVTAAVRDPQRMTEQSEYLTVVQADILNPNSVTDVVKGTMLSLAHTVPSLEKRKNCSKRLVLCWKELGVPARSASLSLAEREV